MLRSRSRSRSRRVRNESAGRAFGPSPCLRDRRQGEGSKLKEEDKPMKTFTMGEIVRVEGAPRSALWCNEAHELGGEFYPDTRVWLFPRAMVVEVEALVERHRQLCPCHSQPLPYPGAPCRA